MIASGHKEDFSEEMSSKELAVRWKFSQLDTSNNTVRTASMSEKRDSGGNILRGRPVKP